jgi:hypothetical protein
MWGDGDLLSLFSGLLAANPPSAPTLENEGTTFFRNVGKHNSATQHHNPEDTNSLTPEIIFK